jgi:hypothetical protein
MLRTFRWALGVFSLAAFSLASHAAELAPAMQVLGLQVGDSNLLMIKVSENTRCGSPILIVEKKQIYYKEMLELALLAYSTGKELHVWFDTCDLRNRAVLVRMALGSVE